MFPHAGDEPLPFGPGHYLKNVPARAGMNRRKKEKK